MKKYLVIILCIFIIAAGAILLINISRNERDEEVKIDYEKSFLVDFELIDNKVDIKCNISLVNASEKNRTIILYAVMPKEVKTGLLTFEKCIAIDSNGDIEKVDIPKNSVIEREIVFRGVYGGQFIKANRLLPNINIIVVE